MLATQSRPIQSARPSRGTSVLPQHLGLMVVELALLIGTLALAAIVKVHPGPLPGDLGVTIAWQHLVRPIPLLTSSLDFISMITWPTYVAVQLAVLAVVFLLCRRWLDLVLTLLTLGAADGSNFVISQFDQRPRPVGAGLYVHQQITNFFSFPSGHVEHALAFLGILVFLSFQVRRPHAWLWLVRVPLIAMAALMGPARLLEGEHWPSDILAGLLWGGFWLIAAIVVYGWVAARWPQLAPSNERKDPDRGIDDAGGATAEHQIARSALATPVQGLSDEEVRTRRQQGRGNTGLPTANRSYGQILRENFLTFITISLFVLGFALLALGRLMDALASVGLIFSIAFVSAAQEIRAKRILDQSAVVSHAQVTVVRQGREQRVAGEELVLGDLVKVEAGDQIIVDGRIVGPGQIVVDESRLSGKPQYMTKRAGDHLISGSVCVGGSATYVAEKVGPESVIHRVASRARITRRTITPLQRQINFVFSLSLLGGLFIELLLVVRAVVSAQNIVDSVEQSAVIANLVPQALVLSIAVAYAIGAVRVLRFGALAQEANAIESLSNLTVLCLDKTGTLTSNQLRVERLKPITIGEEEHGLTPLEFVGLREELRPEARDTLAALRESGVEIKIVSGDDPETVAAVARQAGIDSQAKPISGPDLAAMEETEQENIAQSAEIFGRMTAELKEKLVEALQRRGHYVGMVGDGLNDVLALKQAQVGIAMQSGSEVARDAADIVLLNDSLSALAPVVAEGQRIVNGMQATLKLYLTRIAASALVILSSLAVAELFPMRLRHGTILTLATVGVPAVFLTLWARPGPIHRDTLMRQQGHFVIPAAVLSGIIGLVLFYGVLMVQVLPFIPGNPHYTQAQIQATLQKGLPTAQTELASFLILTGLALIVFVAPPTKWWAGGSAVKGSWWPTVLALALTIGFGVIMEVPLFRSLFGLAPLGGRHMLAVVGAAALWLLVVRAVWRAQLGERFLGLERNSDAWSRDTAHREVHSSENVQEINWTTDTTGTSRGLE